MIDPRWIYADTSIVVKRYVRESGSDQANRITSARDIATSALTSVEVVSTLFGKHRGGYLSTRSLEAALAQHELEKRYWTVIELTPLVLARAEDIIRRVAARTADAVHVASAVFFSEAAGIQLPLATADAKQRQSAEDLGMQVLWIGPRR
jgi:predicted nucleic acid-binding protein